MPKPPASVSVACMAWWWLLLLAIGFMFLWWFWVLPNWDYWTSGGQRTIEEVEQRERSEPGP